MCMAAVDSYVQSRGGSRIFMGGGGGGAKDYMRARTSQARNPMSLMAGRRGGGGGLMISRAIWASILSILIQQWDTKNTTIDLFFFAIAIAESQQ